MPAPPWLAPRGRSSGRTILKPMEQAEEKRWLIAVYAATIFSSALLLFQVQPIISRLILPWFGGTPAVWTTAMLFFQTLLLVGYIYAHVSVQYFRPRWQIAMHLLLLIGAAATLPFMPNAAWKPSDGANPVLRILLLLAVTVGLPYFMLAATGPLVQVWFTRTMPGRSPYRLYSLSNLGSLLALVTYPILIEPRLALGAQADVWRWAFWVFAGLCGVGGIIAVGDTRMGDLTATLELPVTPTAASEKPRGRAARRRQGSDRDAAPTSAPTFNRRLLWLLLPALASTAFLATTSFSCQDTPTVPFLCIFPLALYLLSFVICFDRERWYWPRATAGALVVTLLAAVVYAYLVGQGSATDRIEVDVGLTFAALFFLCMLCHGELVRLKPDPLYLTSFYLMVAAGGALGGLFVGIVAPLVFSGYQEWYIALWGGLILALAILLGTGERGLFRKYAAGFLPATAIFALALITAGKLAATGKPSELRPVESRRNFYGVLTVKEYFFQNELTARMLYNGHILHGLQFTHSLERRLPTAYYGWESGVGRVMRFYQDKSAAGLRVGAIGLGTGTMAAYARRQDQLVFYEINPEVVTLARQYFTFLDDADQRMKRGDGSRVRGRLNIIMGDARLSLERDLTAAAGPAQFDVIVLDAFTGDAIPTHFLTREAADIYRRHLAPGGTLAIHISNRYLDLTPVVRGLAEYLQLGFVEIETPRNYQRGEERADWALLTANTELRAALEKPAATVPTESVNVASEDFLGATDPPREKTTRPPLLWTDDFSDLFSILR